MTRGAPSQMSRLQTPDRELRAAHTIQRPHPPPRLPTALPDTLCAHHRRLAAWRTLLDAKATHG